MPQPSIPVGTNADGVRAFDPQTSSPITVDPERMQADYVAGKLQLVKGMDYAMRDADGKVWMVPADEANQALAKGASFAAHKEHVQQEAAKPENAWRAAADGALNAATFGLGDGMQVKLGADADALQARAEAHPVARAVGGAGGMAATMLLTGGMGVGGLAAGEAATAALAERGAGALLAKLGGNAVAGAVEGAAFGAGDAMSEVALGNSEDVAEALLAHAGAGALLGGVVGGAAGAVGSAVKWAAGKAAPRVKDLAELYARGAGAVAEAEGGVATSAASLAAARKEASAAAKSATALKPQVAKAAKEAAKLRAAADALPPSLPGMPPHPLLAQADEAVAAASAIEGRAAEAAERAAKAQATIDTHRAAVTKAREIQKEARGALRARDNAVGMAAENFGRGAGASAGGAVFGPVGAFVGAQVGGDFARRASQTAAVQRALTEVASRISKGAAAVASGARSEAPTLVGRIAPATAAMLQGDERARDAAFADRAAEVTALAESPDLATDRFAAATAHLQDATPEAAWNIHMRGADAIAYLRGILPQGTNADAFGTSPAIPAQARAKFARVDAALQDPLRVLRADATADEVKAVATVMPRLHARLQQAVMSAVDPAKLSWPQRQHLQFVWGINTHNAYNPHRVNLYQATYTAQPKRGPGRPPKPSSAPPGVAMSEPDKLTYGM